MFHYFLKLIPCRPDFAQTMNEQERNIMLQHIDYWKKYMDEGITIRYRPILDPKGVYGIGIIAVDNEDQVKELIKNDPASQINTYEYFPMRVVVKSVIK